MALNSGSLSQFMKERYQFQTDELGNLERGRELVENSGLLRMMQETCVSINKMAGSVIVDSHSFLPPEPVICCFIFVEEGTEFVIRLEVQGAIPTLVFSERRWRDTVTNDFVRWAYRLAEIEPVTITIKLVHEFQKGAIAVEMEQVRQWFLYLISGMDRSRAPSFR
jgi:hypothetical protein